MDLSSFFNDLKTRAPHLDDAVAADWLQSLEREVRQDADQNMSFTSDAEMNAYIGKKIDYSIRSLSGFSSHDIGILLVESTGGFFPFDGADARSVVSKKLCLQTPGEVGGAMHRAIELKDLARKKFESKMRSFGLKMNHDAYEKLRSLEMSGGVKNHEWIRAFPGAIYSDSRGETWVVDFKIPGTEETFESISESAPDYYRAPFVMYEKALAAVGIKMDHSVLVPFSYGDWNVAISEFILEDSLRDNVMSAGDSYWLNNVKKAELPMRPFSKNFEHIKEAPPAFQEAVMRYALEKRMESIIKNNASRTKNTLVSLAKLSGIDLDGLEDGKVRVCGIDFSNGERKTKNYELMLSALKEDPNVDLNDEKFFSTSSSLRVSLVRSKKDPFYGMISDMEEIAQRSVDFALDDVMASSNYSLTVDDVARMVSDPTSPLYQREEVFELAAQIGLKVQEVNNDQAAPKINDLGEFSDFDRFDEFDQVF